MSACSRETGLHVNSVNKSAISCLHVAVLHGHVDMFHLLLRRGAHVNARTKPHQNTALHLAAAQSDNCQVSCRESFIVVVVEIVVDVVTPLGSC